MLGDADINQLGPPRRDQRRRERRISTALPKYLSPIGLGAKPTPRDEWTSCRGQHPRTDAVRKGFGFKASPRARRDFVVQDLGGLFG